jgi:hypothetical protein
MGDTLWVDVCGRSKDDYPQDNSIMLRMKDQLDHLCRKLNVAKLTDFYDWSELAAQYGDLDYAEESEGSLASDNEGQSGGS